MGALIILVGPENTLGLKPLNKIQNTDNKYKFCILIPVTMYIVKKNICQKE